MLNRTLSLVLGPDETLGEASRISRPTASAKFWTLGANGHATSMEDYLGWLTNVVARAHQGSVDGIMHVQPLHGIGMESTLTEEFGPQLAGYRGVGPVRRGNQAYEHFQHDDYGNVVLGAAQAFHDRRLLQPAGRAEFHHLEGVGEQSLRVHLQADAGTWELRTRSRVHTSSLLMC